VSEIPDNWERTPLEALGQWGSGGTPKRTNPGYYDGGKIPWLIIGDLNDGAVTHSATHITELGLANSSAKLLPAETLLIAMYGSIGKLGITGFECATNQAIAFCKPDDHVTTLRYLFYALMNAKSGLIAQGQGGAQQNISQGILKAHEVPLAPLNEQKRIADKLDAVLARVDACRDHLNRIPAILKRFRQSVLAAATSGKLTEEWRVEREISFDNWTEISLDEACIKITDGEHISPVLTASGIPLISAKDVREWGVDFSDTKFVSAEFSKVSRRRCKPELNDVLVVSRGATVGRTCLITSENEFCLMGSVLLFKPAVDMVNPRYMAAFLRSPLGLERLTGASGASAQAAIYIRDTKKLLIVLPTKEEQTEIVRRVEALFACADRLEARYVAARAQVEKLIPATLAKAFRGELVPQDPNDEPASVLLARIAAARTETANNRTANKRK